ncbi:hypothetical protein SPMU_29090 [Sphingomonas mucosissima]|uniref:Uncharacterized protein n=2 Tax=Sphingomonas mucosissima TaxID=370959 RepID=A0A245ZFY9_9SPHN|nr:hypothetical protein SPMU_29090 [Sphingomonas mucosissima]
MSGGISARASSARVGAGAGASASRGDAARWMPGQTCRERGRTARLDGGRLALLSLSLLLAACAKQVPSAVNQAAATPGFLLGLWHGFIFPVAWVLSLFMPDVAIYAVPNNGGWYDFGYFIGVVFLGVGARKTRTVYVSRRVVR